MKDQKTEKKIIRVSPGKIILVVLLIWVLSLVAVWFLAKASWNKKYSLLNPRLETIASETDSPEERNSKLFTTILPLKEELLSYLDVNKPNVSFYIEDLNSGSWTGWKERDPFIPASLLKVPVAIGVMKKIDQGDWSLNTTFMLEPTYKDKTYGNLWQEPDNKTMTIEKLMEEMLQNSDNTAANLLFDKLSKEERENVYYHIGLVNPEEEGKIPGRPTFKELSAKDLATMFRALYNATYLKSSSSSYVLDLLTKTNFDKDLSYQIPDNVTIAHKIGNFIYEGTNIPKNNHDCGIVYYSQHPFSYCILTQNLEPEQAEKIILEIRYMAYQYFDKNGNKK